MGSSSIFGVPSITWWDARKTEIPWAVWLALCSVNLGLLDALIYLFGKSFPFLLVSPVFSVTSGLPYRQPPAVSRQIPATLNFVTSGKPKNGYHSGIADAPHGLKPFLNDPIFGKFEQELIYL